ncbi:putative holin-like toxin [Lapidilactobacillus achengensis]|uniref:Holin-like toxin n=1 Tax=Lapidilactobacillus achengensis TaxID=2486000 RepID=A0ABW1UPA8_9LACO
MSITEILTLLILTGTFIIQLIQLVIDVIELGQKK